MSEIMLTPELLKNALSNRELRPENIPNGHFAVIALLFETDRGPELLFCKRAMTLKRQPGDVCFPGGKQEGTETPMETALREMTEEVGLKPEDVTLLGETDFVVTMYHAYVRPFVAVVKKGITLSDLTINPAEVDKIFTVPLQFFRETKPLITKVNYIPDFPEDFPYHMIVGGKNYGWGRPTQTLYFYEYEGEIIWGLTARVVRSLCRLIDKYLNK